MTIPLQITLSEFKLSGFVILVFSKQKGITVVFRNDPLESLKVSSTFDSIPFVSNFLQKAIEAQLRTLFMDELPAIIHRLSLRLWVPEYRADEEVRNRPTGDGPGQDPLASPPQDPVDALGNVLNESQIASLSLDSSIESHSLFSQKNLLRLAALTDSQRTLSLFTPSIQEVVYRAGASPSDQGELHGNVMPLNGSSLDRVKSNNGSVASFPDTASVASMQSMQSSRPSLLSHNFSGYGLSLGAGRHKSHARKRKKRVLNLRQPKAPTETASMSDAATTFTDTTDSPSIYSAPVPAQTTSEEQDDPVTPPLSPISGRRLPSTPEHRRRTFSPAPAPRREVLAEVLAGTGAGEPSSSEPSKRPVKAENLDPLTNRNNAVYVNRAVIPYAHQKEKETGASASSSRPESQHSGLSAFVRDQLAGGSMDQELLDRLAGEVAHRMREKVVMDGSLWDRTPPPAYGQ